MGLKDKNTFEYWRISAGAIRKTAREDDPESKVRTIKNDDGSKRDIWEIVKGSIEGVIDGVELVDGNFGRQLMITINDGIDQFKLQLPWDSSYTRTFLERLPNVDLSKDVEIVPYSFKTEQGKPRSGVNIYQDGKKIMSWVKKYDADGKFMEWIDGFPHFTDGMDKDDFKIVGARQMKWFKENIVDVYPFFEGTTEGAVEGADDEDDGRPLDSTSDDLPF